MKNYVLHNKGTVFMSVGVCGGGDGFIAGVNIFFNYFLSKSIQHILAGRVLHAGVSDTPCVWGGDVTCRCGAT